MIQLSPIGILRTPFTDPKNMPIQPTGGHRHLRNARTAPEFADGLRDLDGFSHIILLYHFHKAQGHELLVTPFLDKTERGVLCHTGSPPAQSHRPFHRAPDRAGR